MLGRGPFPTDSEPSVSGSESEKEEGRSGYAVFAALSQSLKGLASRRRGNGMELRSSDVVEVRGIEPLSESVSSGTSPGADGNLQSLAQARAVTLESLVAS